MGTWGSGIFDNDVALDVRYSFEDALAEVGNVSGATQWVLEEFAEALEDIDDGPVIYVALVALQLEHGAVQPETRKTALDMIANGKLLDRWTDHADAIAYQDVLDRLKNALLMT